MSQVLDEKLEKLSQEERRLWELRHTAEHVLHQAVKELYPSIHLAMGPATDEGFYFDFDGAPEGKDPVKITEAEFPAIEKRMQEIIAKNLPLIRREITPEEAAALFKDNPYKTEWINQIRNRGEKVTIYWTGEPGAPGSMVDLCGGPHAASTAEVKAFKLLSVAGAYWHGDEKNKMLTRIYGTAYGSKKELDEYLAMMEEAKKRDHRKIGRDQELFLISPSVGPGFPLYMPRGFILKRELERWIMKEKEARGYQFVWTPHVAKSDLYRQSGHWQKYDAMMSPMKLDEDEYVVKPMNCPHHFQIYNERPRSYRELPLRIAENATVYRFEKAGEVNGLLRVRALTQDDSHIFVRHAQIADEIDRILDLTLFVYKTFGFKDFRARISIRDPKNPDKYMGDPKNWDRAEQALVDATKKRDLPYFVGEGEAAFYGPKIDIVVKDAMGRQWQLTTCQLDFVQPENFTLRYINEEGKEDKPAVLHVAILGAVDRFLAILIEHFGGAFPLWLSPVQVGIIPIAERHQEAAKKVADALMGLGIRVQVEDKNGSMQAKIRTLTLQKVPYLGIIGDREAESGGVSVRTRTGEDLKAMSLESFASRLKDEIEHTT